MDEFLIIELATGNCRFQAGTLACLVIEGGLIPDGLARCLYAERRPGGTRVYELTAEGINLYKTIRAKRAA